MLLVSFNHTGECGLDLQKLTENRVVSVTVYTLSQEHFYLDI